jgi:hypothetical protein
MGKKIMVGNGWDIPKSLEDSYINKIREFLSDEEKFKNFRKNKSEYTPILEHVTKQNGYEYAKTILNKFPNEIAKYLNDFKKNDNVGNPILYNYERFGLINPTTLRYIYFGLDIYNNFGDLDNINLIEIGGGYGGLVRILSIIYDFKNIKLFDLDEPLLLQKKYLKNYNINVETYSLYDKFDVDNNTIVISNFAWSECNDFTRKKYIEKIIKKCKYIYISSLRKDILKEFDGLNGDKIKYIKPLGRVTTFVCKNNLNYIKK